MHQHKTHIAYEYDDTKRRMSFELSFSRWWDSAFPDNAPAITMFSPEIDACVKPFSRLLSLALSLCQTTFDFKAYLPWILATKDSVDWWLWIWKHVHYALAASLYSCLAKHRKNRIAIAHWRWRRTSSRADEVSIKQVYTVERWTTVTDCEWMRVVNWTFGVGATHTKREQ